MIDIDRDDDGYMPAVLRQIADVLESEGREVALEISEARKCLAAERAQHADTRAQLHHAQSRIRALEKAAGAPR